MEKLILNKHIYSLKCIKQTVDAFADLCKMVIIDSHDQIIVEFSKFKYSPDKTIHEFENYLIGLENQ